MQSRNFDGGFKWWVWLLTIGFMILIGIVLLAGLVFAHWVVVKYWWVLLFALGFYWVYRRLRKP